MKQAYLKLNSQWLNCVGNIDTFLFKKADSDTILKLSKTQVSLECTGEQSSFDVTSNTSWKVKQGKEVKWNEGEGYLFFTYNGVENDTVYVSSDENEGIGRTQSVKIEAVDGSVSKSIVIQQKGLRQRFMTSDYSVFRTADGSRYGVLEKELPYTPLSYLESTGTQYIDTNYAFKDNFAWEITFEGITDSATLFGGRTSSVRTAILFQLASPKSTVCPIAGFNGTTTPFKFSDLSTGKHTVKLSIASNKGSAWVDGTQLYNNESFTGSYISGTTQALFADKYNDGSFKELTSSKVYSLKMWQNGELVRNFIPVLDANGVPCMYDKTNDAYYYNSGTGSFKIGK